MPEIGVLSDIDYSKDTLIHNTNLSFNVRVTDSDSSFNELSFDLVIGGAEIPGSFSPDTSTEIEGDGNLVFDLSSLQNGGLYSAEIRVFDGDNYDSVIFESWFAGNRRTITIQQDVDASDGFGSDGDKISKNYTLIPYSDDWQNIPHPTQNQTPSKVRKSDSFATEPTTRPLTSFLPALITAFGK